MMPKVIPILEQKKEKGTIKSFITPIIKSPLRFPGGKSKAIKYIIPLIPDFDEYREPMVGGGSLFFALKQRFPERKYWINDIDPNVYWFWITCRDSPFELVLAINSLKEHYKNGRKLYDLLIDSANKPTNNIDIAARFFILNRITFSGLTESGGYSEQAFRERFTQSSITRIITASTLLQGVKITNKDFSELTSKNGDAVFVFLDPPYYSNSKSRLYGKRGQLHIKFNHEVFFDQLRSCKHSWLVTYDNCSKIERLFNKNRSENWLRLAWKLKYGINNPNRQIAKVGEELFILNYTIPTVGHDIKLSGFNKKLKP